MTGPGEVIFNHVEPVATEEMLGNYWHFLRSLTEADRLALGPIEIVLKSRTTARGWPVALKNRVMALATEVTMSPKSGVAFVDISEVATVTFYGAHMILPFLTEGAVARSPFEKKLSQAEATAALLKVCEDIRAEWRARLYFAVDPSTHSLDEIINLIQVLKCVRDTLPVLRENKITESQLDDVTGFHVINTSDKDPALTARHDGSLELSFQFARALPAGLNDLMLALFNSAL